MLLAKLAKATDRVPRLCMCMCFVADQTASRGNSLSSLQQHGGRYQNLPNLWQAYNIRLSWTFACGLDASECSLQQSIQRNQLHEPKERLTANARKNEPVHVDTGCSLQGCCA